MRISQRPPDCTFIVFPCWRESSNMTAAIGFDSEWGERAGQNRTCYDWWARRRKGVDHRVWRMAAAVVEKAKIDLKLSVAALGKF